MRHFLEAETMNELEAFGLSHNLFYFLCVIIKPGRPVLRRSYEGWLCSGLYF